MRLNHVGLGGSLLSLVLYAGMALAYDGVYTGVTRRDGEKHVLVLRIRCPSTHCTVTAQHYIQKRNKKKAGLVLFGGTFAAGPPYFVAWELPYATRAFSAKFWRGRWIVTVPPAPTLTFSCKCRKNCKPLCDDLRVSQGRRTRCVVSAPTPTPTPAAELSTSTWSGAWNCAGPGNPALTIDGAGAGSSMRAAYAATAYGPAHEEYRFESIGEYSAVGTYTYYDNHPPGAWAGSFSLTISGSSIHLERQDKATAWRGSYTCQRK